MATPSGTIGLSDVNAELGFSPTALITMNDAAVRTLAGVPSGVISMANLQNKSNRVTISLTISANTTDYDVYTNRGPSYDAGKSDITVTINSGITVSGTSTGSAAFRVPSSFNPADTVTIINNGTIVGRGGVGGNGRRSSPPPGPANIGGTGGPALLVQFPITMQNINRIAGGGGGGGGGGVGFNNVSGGGGGGGGVASGSGGSGAPANQSPGSPGSSGSLTAGGGGGPGGSYNDPEAGGTFLGGPGGTGGGYGASGSSGGGGSPRIGPASDGAPGGGTGAAITGNPLITYSGPTGTRNGPIS